MHLFYVKPSVTCHGVETIPRHSCPTLSHLELILPELGLRDGRGRHRTPWATGRNLGVFCRPAALEPGKEPGCVL